MLNHYVYLVYRPNGSPCYVGKGSGKRWKQHKSRAKVNAHYRAILERAGGELRVEIIHFCPTETEAFAIEEQLTQFFGIESEGGLLVNCGYGGRGGPSGVKRSEAWRANRKLKAMALWQDENYRAMMLRPDRNRGGNFHPRSEAFKTIVAEKMKGNKHTLGRSASDETRAKMSAARKGKPKTESHRRAIAAALTGQRHSSERIEKNRQSHIGKIVPLDVRQRTSVTLKGRSKPEGFAEKMSAEMKGRWADPEYKIRVAEAIRLNVRPMSESHRAAVIASNQRRRKSVETCQTL